MNTTQPLSIQKTGILKQEITRSQTHHCKVLLQRSIATPSQLQVYIISTGERKIAESKLFFKERSPTFLS